MPTDTVLKEEKGSKKPCGCGGSGSPVVKAEDCGCGGKCGGDGRCQCHGETCCDLACLSHPNYFCGHLLTDEDLRLEHHYFAEKLKMYHRTLHGAGVVCGLPLSCDPDCRGWIRIGEGYAIDDCGRDLVVCSSLRYNLIDELTRRGWILEGPKPDPCHPEEPPPDCPDTQCFYILLRYREKKDQFTTPLRGACQDGPASCEATRIHETVCIELSRKKPQMFGDLVHFDVEAELSSQFETLDQSLFGQKLSQSKQKVSAILAGSVTDDACELFCQLQYLFLLYLKQHPPLLHCQLTHQVAALNCKTQRGNEEVMALFCEFFGYVQTYLMDHVMTALLPKCPKPSVGCDVVLGTVEVKAGRIVQICHTPRQYVWTFLNAVPLVFQTLIQNILNRYGKRDGEDRCCADYPFNCSLLSRAMAANELDFRQWMLAPVKWMKSFGGSLARAFDFADSEKIPVHLLQNVTRKQMETVMRAFRLQSSEAPREAVEFSGNPVTAFLASTLQSLDTPFQIKENEDGTISAMAESVFRFRSIERKEEPAIDELRNEIRKRDTSIAELKSLYEEQAKKVKDLSSTVAALRKKEG